MTQPPPGDVDFFAIVVAGCNVALTVLVAVASGVWALSKSKIATDDKIAGGKLAADDKIAIRDKALSQELIELERRVHAGTDTAVRMFGETVAAIRAKVSEIELWNRDNFVAIATFQVAIQDMKVSWQRFEDQLNLRFDAIDKKLDRSSHESRHGP